MESFESLSNKANSRNAAYGSYCLFSGEGEEIQAGEKGINTLQQTMARHKRIAVQDTW